MPINIRLKRFGRRNRPFYRIVVADCDNPRQGVSLDDIGYYNPLTDPADFKIDEERALEWLNRGAHVTDTVKSLLSKAGILKKFHEQKLQSQKVRKSENE